METEKTMSTAHTICTTLTQSMQQAKFCPWHHVNLEADASGFPPSTSLSSILPAVSFTQNKKEKAGALIKAPSSSSELGDLATPRVLCNYMQYLVPTQLLCIPLVKAFIISSQTQINP